MNNNLSFYLNELPVDMLEEIFSYLPEDATVPCCTTQND